MDARLYIESILDFGDYHSVNLPLNAPEYPLSIEAQLRLSY